MRGRAYARWLALVAVLSWPSAAPATPDIDGDGIPDVFDKCALDSRNAVSTCDSDMDGYGNVCDGDFNQSNVVNVIDADQIFSFLPSTSVPPAPAVADMDCNNAVDSIDYTQYFVPNFRWGKPGISGLGCAGAIGCQ